MADQLRLDPFGSVSQLAGIGPKLTAGLTEAGAARLVDLLLHLPRRYEDRTQVVPVAAARVPDTWVLLRGRLRGIRGRRTRRWRGSVVQAVLDDDTGSLPVIWFNAPWVARRAPEIEQAYLYGPLRTGRSGRLELVNPELEEVEEGQVAERLVPIYPPLGPLAGRRLRRTIGLALPTAESLPDPVPGDVLSKLRLPELAAAVASLHAPPRDAGLERLNRRRTPAHDRLAFDELLAFCCGVMDLKRQRELLPAPRCVVDPAVRELARAALPFALTAAQRRVLSEIAADLEGDHPMARLLQGDVGSGKTAVAALALLTVLESGHQGALMAPTELLAEQHHRTLSTFFAKTRHRVHLLTSSQPAPEQRRVREALAAGEVCLVVGTHALIQEAVDFADLGLAVVDEQHRFGVAQRQALLAKGRSPHLLVMTATPIPRSLALTVYGDLELSVIDELPPGRQPVRTEVRTPAARPRLFAFIAQELAAGGRAYVVYPLIDASEQVQARALAEHVDEVRAALPGASVGILHGRLSRPEREAVTEAFRKGEVSVLLSTTVVEVGVDVPEASVMVVESADRFGLSQLHQLRGRVGRGPRQSWCVLLVDDDIAEESRRRLEVLCRTQDGFAVAEADLKLRGPGELTGTRQWGPSQFRFADLFRHRRLIAPARAVARELAASGRLDAVRDALARYHPVELSLPPG